jgi:hypothetical protein
MTRHPFDSGELGRTDPEMDRLGEGLERYAVEAGGEPPMDLASRIRATLDDEPTPARGWWGALMGVFAPWHGIARLALGTAVVAAAVIGALVLGDLADQARNNNVGSTPTPSPSETLTPSPTSTPSPTQSPSPTPSPSIAPTPSVRPTPTPSVPATVVPTATDDDGGVETPSPSESDSSGSGSDNSGPGGGD